MSSLPSLPSLPNEVHLSILQYYLTFSTPIPLSRCHFADTWDGDRFLILPLLLVCKFYHKEGLRILYEENYFLFAMCSMDCWDFGCDWWQMFSSIAPIGIGSAMDRMKHVVFEPNWPVGVEIAQLAIRLFKSLETLEIDFTHRSQRDQGVNSLETEQLVSVSWERVTISGTSRQLRRMQYSGLELWESTWWKVVYGCESMTCCHGTITSYK